MSGVDRRLASALAERFGHALPIGADECARSPAPLVVREAEDLTGLESLTGLRRLGLFGCVLPSLAPVAPLFDLVELKIACCTLTSIEELRRLPSLRRLEINYCLVSDASPLLQAAHLEWAALFGNPWSEASYAQLRELRAVAVELSPEPHWRLTRKLVAAGLPLVYGARPGQTPRLVRPGPGIRRIVDASEVSEAEVEAALASPPLDEDGQPPEDADDFFYRLEGPEPRAWEDEYWSPFGS